MHYSAHLAAVCASASLIGATHAQGQPQAGSYRLGSGDRIAIDVAGEPELSVTRQLTETGWFSYPFLGAVHYESLTTSELALLIANGLDGAYLVDPHVTVKVVEYRPVLVLGDVAYPGRVAYQTEMTVARLIALAGGFTDRASRSAIKIVRAVGGRAVAAGPNDLVYPGDVVTVSDSDF